MDTKNAVKVTLYDAAGSIAPNYAEHIEEEGK